ncbi:MAG: hypothetical protein QM770_10265 [Tepidisphaeraceae bacterium]
MAIPDTDMALLDWARNLYDVAHTAPDEYGYTPELMTDFNVVLTRFATDLAAARVIETRTRVAVAEKNASRLALRRASQTLYKVADGWPEMSDAKRVALGINVRKQRSPRPTPTSCPAVNVVSVVGRTVTVAIRDSETSGTRRRPTGVAGAWLYAFVGDNYPSNPAQWRFWGATVETTHEIVFDFDVPGGAQVWVCAAWINARLQPGPRSTPISTHLQGGGRAAVSALPTTDVKIAA